MNRSTSRYYKWLAMEHPDCVCGGPYEQLHHIIHINHQRITKDNFLVVGLCRSCHQGKDGIHDLGGERQFLEHTGWNLVEIAVLRRHNWEVANG